MRDVGQNPTSDDWSDLLKGIQQAWDDGFKAGGLSLGDKCEELPRGYIFPADVPSCLIFMRTYYHGSDGEDGNQVGAFPVLEIAETWHYNTRNQPIMDTQANYTSTQLFQDRAAGYGCNNKTCVWAVSDIEAGNCICWTGSTTRAFIVYP